MNLAATWSRRSPNERRVLAAGALLVAAVLVLTLAWLPLERARTRLANDLPRLRAATAALQRDADEVKRLRAMPGYDEVAYLDQVRAWAGQNGQKIGISVSAVTAMMTVSGTPMRGTSMKR